MNKLLNIITPLHKRTSRNYIGRMNDNKVECMIVARKFSQDFWDGNRRYGYGGYKYIPNRWEEVARTLIKEYDLPKNAKILDVGCGKGFLLYEFKKLFVNKAEKPYNFGDKEFDLVISITTLHNLYINDLKMALIEIERVGKNKYVVVESYRNEKELFNLQCWALTCEAFFTPREWTWLFDEFGYAGDYEFIYFE